MKIHKDKKVQHEENLKMPETEPVPEKEQNEQQAEQSDDKQKLENEIKILKDTLLRKAAEFDNYKKRTEAETLNIFKYASENLIKELLPVLDDLNRSVGSVEKGETKDFETLKTGLFLIADKFRDVLSKEGLKEIECLGKEFDVSTCDALLQVPKDDTPPNLVTDVVEKGYYLKDKIIRHAKVIVSA